MKNTPIDTPATVRQTGRGVRTSIRRAHTSVNLTANLANWARNQATSKGIKFSEYLELVLRKEYERVTNPPRTATVNTDSNGRIVSLSFKDYPEAGRSMVWNVSESPSVPDKA